MRGEQIAGTSNDKYAYANGSNRGRGPRAGLFADIITTSQYKIEFLGSVRSRFPGSFSRTLAANLGGSIDVICTVLQGFLANVNSQRKRRMQREGPNWGGSTGLEDVLEGELEDTRTVQWADDLKGAEA